MPETQAYRLRFNEDHFVTVDFSSRTVQPMDDPESAEGRPTCGGVWCRDLGLKSPTLEMSFAERRAVHAENQAKIAAAGADPHQTHRTIVLAALALGATPENLLDFCHVIGPAERIQGIATKNAGAMTIEVDVMEEIDGEMVSVKRPKTIPIVSGFGVVGDVGPHVQVTRLPKTWTLEPA